MVDTVACANRLLVYRCGAAQALYLLPVSILYSIRARVAVFAPSPFGRGLGEAFKKRKKRDRTPVKGQIVHEYLMRFLRG